MEHENLGKEKISSLIFVHPPNWALPKKPPIARQKKIRVQKRTAKFAHLWPFSFRPCEAFGGECVEKTRSSLDTTLHSLCLCLSRNTAASVTWFPEKIEQKFRLDMRRAWGY